MDKIIKNVLLKIQNEGYEAYLVGGYVRDYLLGKKTCDVDICTNALPKVLHKIFPSNTNSNSYGGFNLKIKQYNIDITTYRKEIKYENRKPVELIYINNLLEDLKRRDFTINALCMNEKEKIIDPLNGIKDIENRKIKIIGDVQNKLQEDPLRILRAIRFSALLDFDIDNELLQVIKNNPYLVENLSGQRIKEEINKILLCDNCKKGMELIQKLNLNKYLGLDYDVLIKCSDINMMWAQIETNKIPFTKVEKNYIIKLRELIEFGNINEKTLFKYGLYLNSVASEYLGITKKDVNKIYKKMSIKNEKDLNILTCDIINVLGIKPSKKIGVIRQNLIDKILNHELKNDKKNIINYLKQNKGMWQDE